MSDINLQNFEPRIAEQSSLRGAHQELEADMQRLSKEVMEKRNLPEYKNLSDKEIIKEAIRPLIKSDEYQANMENKAVIEAGEKDFLPDYALEFPPEKKLEAEKVIDFYFHKGFFKTIEEVKSGVKSGKYGVEMLDIFHDALADKLSKELDKELEKRK